MSTNIFPYEVWQSGTNENSIPANDNALRSEVISKEALGFVDADPGGSPHVVYVVGTSWGGFATDDVVIRVGGSWEGFRPFNGWIKYIAGDVYIYDGSSGWSVFSGGGGNTPAPIVTESGTSLTADDTNAGNYTRFTSASAKTYTFDGAETYEVGAEYHGRNVGAGDLTLTEAGGFTLNDPVGGTNVVAQGGTFTVKIVAADEADIIGVTVPA